MIVEEIKFYIERNVQKYLIFGLICSGLRVVGLAVIWIPLAYYLNFGLLEGMVLIALGILYIYSEFFEHIFRKNTVERLSLEERKW